MKWKAYRKGGEWPNLRYSSWLGGGNAGEMRGTIREGLLFSAAAGVIARTTGRRDTRFENGAGAWWVNVSVARSVNYPGFKKRRLLKILPETQSSVLNCDIPESAWKNWGESRKRLSEYQISGLKFVSSVSSCQSGSSVYPVYTHVRWSCWNESRIVGGQTLKAILGVIFVHV